MEPLIGNKFRLGRKISSRFFGGIYLDERKRLRLSCYHSTPIVFSQAKESDMWDPQENRYLDFLAAYSAINQSYGPAKSYRPAKSHQRLMVLHCSGLVGRKSPDIQILMGLSVNF